MALDERLGLRRRDASMQLELVKDPSRDDVVVVVEFEIWQGFGGP